MKKLLHCSFSLLTSWILVTSAANAQAPLLSFQSLVTTLSEPVDVVNAGDGSNRLFIVEKPGRIRIYKNGALQTTPFLNISTLVTNDVGGERGFLSLAFHPAYATNRYFFVYYNNTAGNVNIARYQASATNPDSALPSSGVVLMTIIKPFTNHNGGKLNFGKDGYLYFGTGDGGSGGDPNNNAQNGNSLLGKMIRIDVSNFALPSPYYSIPPTNPYVSDPTVLDEVYNKGLRNPWRWSFDRLTGDTWIADVGQSAWEEVNYKATGTEAGANYGWRCYESNHTYNTTGCNAIGTYSFPIFEYPHNNTTGGFSITGGYVYRGSEFSFLQGYYICADYVSGKAWLIKPNGSGGWNTTIQTGAPSITGFGEAEDGTLYAVSLNGTFYKVNATIPIPVKLLSFTAAKKNNLVALNWITTNEQNSLQFEVEQSTDGINFSQAGIVAAKNGPSDNQYHYDYSGNGTFFRLKIVDRDGRFTYSPVIRISSNPGKMAKVFPNHIFNGELNIFPDGTLQSMQLLDGQGKMVMSKRYGYPVVHDVLDIRSVSKGIYFVKMNYADAVSTERIVVE